MKSKRVLLVDDHPIVRQGLRCMIELNSDLKVCGESGEGKAVLVLIRSTQPDMMILDISLKDISGLEVIKQVRSEFPDLPIMVYTMHEEFLYAERVLRAGAQGYVVKNTGADQVMIAMRKILHGDIYVCDFMKDKIINNLRGSKDGNGVASLSDREMEVLNLAGIGKSTREIAGCLNLSIKTIETHQGNIKKKLELRNALELNRFAMQWVQQTLK